MMRAGRRKNWYWLHMHLGLWAGVLFVLLGITGSLLVFYTDIDSLLNPDTQPTTTCVTSVSAQAVYESLRREYPDKTGSWRIELPLAANKVVAARYIKPPETAHRSFAPLMVTIDPLTYQITSARYWGSYPMTWIYDLHYTLLAEETGHNLVGAIGIILLMAIVLGFGLWMPTRGRILSSMKPNIRHQPVKKVYDFHMMAGIYGGALLVIITLTGVLLAFPQTTTRWAATFLAFDKPMPTSRHLLKAGQSETDLDELIRRTTALFPQEEIRWIETSGDDGREVTFRMFNGNEPSRRFPQTYVKLHPFTGEVLHRRNYHQLPAGDKLWAWVHPLHNGEAFGLAGRWTVMLLGWIPALLLFTGVLRFMQKRKASAYVRAYRAKYKSASHVSEG